MTKQAQVHMLPTESTNPVNVPFLQMPQSGRLVRHAAGGEFRKYLQFGFKPLHLYICTDDEIKENDWLYTEQTVLSNNKSKHYVIEKYIEIIQFMEGEFKTSGKFDSINYKKVVASTESEIEINDIPASFIQQFIDEYNSDTLIKEVIIEYQFRCSNGHISSNKTACIYPFCHQLSDEPLIVLDENGAVKISS